MKSKDQDRTWRSHNGRALWCRWRLEPIARIPKLTELKALCTACSKAYDSCEIHASRKPPLFDFVPLDSPRETIIKIAISSKGGSGKTTWRCLNLKSNKHRAGLRRTLAGVEIEGYRELVEASSGAPSELGQALDKAVAETRQPLIQIRRKRQEPSPNAKT